MHGCYKMKIEDFCPVVKFAWLRITVHNMWNNLQYPLIFPIHSLGALSFNSYL